MARAVGPLADLVRYAGALLAGDGRLLGGGEGVALDEGELGAEEIRNRLDVWWAAQQK
jgi:hypothetical protein